MRFDPAWCVHTGRVNLKPTLGRLIACTANESGAANIRHGSDGLTGGQAVGDFNNRALSIAIQQQVAFRVDHHTAAHLVRPVVVVGNAAQ